MRLRNRGSDAHHTTNPRAPLTAKRPKSHWRNHSLRETLMWFRKKLSMLDISEYSRMVGSQPVIARPFRVV